MPLTIYQSPFTFQKFLLEGQRRAGERRRTVRRLMRAKRPMALARSAGDPGSGVTGSMLWLAVVLLKETLV